MILAIKRCLRLLILGLLGMLCGGLPAWAQAHPPLLYHGGPVLGTFKMYPLYYGTWSSADIASQQNFMVGIAGYLSGQNAPANQQTMMRQYGVQAATTAPAVTASPGATPVKLTDADVRNIIHTSQNNGTLPAYSSDRLIIVFPAHGFSLDITGGCAYHSHESSSAIYAIVPQDCGPTLPLVTGHEIFEAAADPVGNGWDESVDGCSTVINFSFGAIPGAADDRQGGTCSSTGFAPIPAAPSVGSCTPTGVAAFETRIHVRCAAPVNGFSFFSVTTASPDNAARYLSLFTAARVNGRPLNIFFDPADLTGAFFGCANADCRVARGAEFF